MYSSQRLQVERPDRLGDRVVPHQSRRAAPGRGHGRPAARARSTGAWRWLVPTTTSRTGTPLSHRSACALEQADDLVQLALQPAELGVQDDHVAEHDDPGDAVRRRDVVNGGLVDRSGQDHAGLPGQPARSGRPGRPAACRAAPPRTSRRPAQHRRQRHQEGEEHRVVHVGAVPGEGDWVDDVLAQVHRQHRDRDQADAEQCVDGGVAGSPLARLDREAEHEVGAVEEEDDQEAVQLGGAPVPPGAPGDLRPDASR